MVKNIITPRENQLNTKQGEQKHIDITTWKRIVDAVLTEENGIGNYLDRPNTEKIAKKLQERFGNVEQKPAWCTGCKFFGGKNEDSSINCNR